MEPPDMVLELDTLVGLNLRHLREDAGLTRAQLAPQIGVDAERLACVETGIARLSGPQMAALRRALGCSLAALYDEPRAERLLS